MKVFTEKNIKCQVLKVREILHKTYQGVERAKNVLFQSLQTEFETAKGEVGESMADYFTRT